MADLPASSSLRADAPSWQPKAAASVTAPHVQASAAVESGTAGQATAAAGVGLKPTVKRMASPDVASSKAADQEATKRPPAAAAASSKPASNGTTSRPSPVSPTAGRATSTPSTTSQGTARPAVPKGVAKVVLMPRPGRSAAAAPSGSSSGSSAVTSGPPPGLSGGPSSSGAAGPAAHAAHGNSNSSRTGPPAGSSSKQSSGPTAAAAAAGGASANGKGQHSVQDLVVAIDRAWPEDPDPTAAAEAQVKQVLAHHIVTNPTPNQPPYSILASSANQFLNQQLGQGWREALQLPKITDLLKGDPHFSLGPPIKSNRLITVNAELLLRSAGISTGGSSTAAASASKASSRSTDAHVQLSVGKRAAGAAAGTTPAVANSSSSAGGAGKNGPAAAPLPASYSKPPGLGLKQPPQLLGRPGGAAGASCSAASAAVAVAMAVAAADPATAGYTAAIARHWAGDTSGIAQVQQLVALHLVTCSDCASDTVSVNACLEAELGHNWVKRLQFPPLLDMLQADCFILGPRTGPGYKRPIQLDMAALGLGKGAPSRASPAAAAPVTALAESPAPSAAAAPAAGSRVAVVPRMAATAAKAGNPAGSSSHAAEVLEPAAAAGAGAGAAGRAVESPSPKGSSKQASPELLQAAVQAVADMMSAAEAGGVPRDLLSALARRWQGKRTPASLLQHMVALQLVTASDYTGDTTRAYQMVQGWLGSGWREKLAAPRLVEVLLADPAFLVGPPALKMRSLTLNVDLLQGKGRTSASAPATGPAAADQAAKARTPGQAAAAGKQSPAAAAGGSGAPSAAEVRATAQPSSTLATAGRPQATTVDPSVLLEQPLALYPGVALPADGMGGGEPLQVDAGVLSFIALLPSRLQPALLPYASLQPGQVLRGLVLDAGRPAVALLADGGQQQLPLDCTPSLAEALQTLAAAQQAPQQTQQQLVRRFLRWRRAASAAAAAAAASGGSAAGATAGSHGPQGSSVAADSSSLPDGPSDNAGGAASGPSSTAAAGAGVGGQDAAAPLTSELLQQHDQEQVAVGQVTAGRRRSAASSSSSSSSDTGSDKGSEGLLEYLQALGVEVAEGAGGQADADSGAQGTPAVAAVCADAQAAPRSSASAAAEEATPGALEGQASEQASSLVGRAAEAAPGVPQEGAEEAGTGAAPADGVAGTSCVSVNGDSSPCDGTLTSSSSSSDSDDDEGVELCVDVQLQQAMERALSQANPLQVAGTLHRVCAVRGVTGKVTGLTYHVGRHLPRLASVARQVLGRVAAGVNAGHQASLLVVGRPGSGKTTLLQSLAAALAAPCEAGGYGLQVLVVLPASMAPVASAEGTSGTAATPGSGLEAEDCEGTAATAATTSCWGNCRVVVAAPGASMGAAALAAAQQHLAQVVVMDDLSCAEDSQAAAALVTSGVTLVAAARAATLAHLECGPNLQALAAVRQGPCQALTTTLCAQSVDRWTIGGQQEASGHLRR